MSAEVYYAILCCDTFEVPTCKNNDERFIEIKKIQTEGS